MRAAIALFTATAAVALVGLFLPSYWSTLTTAILIWSLLACSLNVVYGYAGMLSFGQAMFFGAGGYATAFSHFSLGAPIPFAIALGTIAGVLAAIPSAPWAARLKGHSFALASLAFSLVAYLAALSRSDVTGGDDGFPFAAEPFEIARISIDVATNAGRLGLVLAFWLVAMAFYVSFLSKARWRLLLQSVRQNEQQAELIGHDTRWYKQVAWTAGAALAALGGSLYAASFQYVNALWFEWTLSANAVIWTVIGGAGTLVGPLVGTVLLIVLEDGLSTINEVLYPIAVGTLLVLVVLFLPAGLTPTLTRGYRKWLTSSDDSGAPAQSFEAMGARTVLPSSKAGGSVRSTVKIDGLWHHAGSIELLRDITLELHSVHDDGGPTFLVGPNGAGKTILMKTIMGIHRHSRGSIRLHDGNSAMDLHHASVFRRAALGVGLMLQDPSVFPELTVEQNLELALRRPRPHVLVPVPKTLQDVEKTEWLIDWLGLDQWRSRAANDLSHGNTRILQLGMTIASEPNLLLLDEPTAGFSATAVHRIADLIHSLCADTDSNVLATPSTILIVEHDLSLVRRLAGRVVVLDRGQVVAGGGGDPRSHETVLSDPSIVRLLTGRSQ